MIAYTVHEPAPEAGRREHDPVARAERIAFVKEGFAWPALFFQPLWLAYHRLWGWLAGFLALALGLPLAAAALGAGAALAGVLAAAIVIVFAFFANDLLRASLARRGYRLVAAVHGRTRLDCERRFFSAWIEEAGRSAGEAVPCAQSSPVAEPRSDRACPARGAGAHVVIIDYGSGNLHSAGKAFERAAFEAGGRLAVKVSADPEDVLRAERIVLPGVGAFADCLRGLERVEGMLAAIDEGVRRRGRPFLGICVGMQLMASRGLEHGETQGFGWIPGEVRPIEPRDPALKIPHMGWNTLDLVRPHPLLAGIPLGPEGLHAYFVHSYHLVPENAAHLVATTDYGGPVTAMVARDNLAGTQFHPEKSQKLGLALIANFLAWRP